MSADPACAAKHSGPVKSEVLVLGQGNTLANVLVRVKAGLPERRWPTPGEPVVMDQRGCRYVPRVLGVMVHQPFKILNSDGLLHNVHALPKVNREFNMAMPAGRTEATETFGAVEDVFTIKCDVHPWMQAHVAVLEHPFFAVTGERGVFSIAGLPAGSYEVEAWHERLGALTRSVTVAEGATAAVDFTFTR
jgi:plastocyanin